jgi:hypothetical protein
MENALVHRVGDVPALEQHLTMLHEDRALLSRLRDACLAAAPDLTWTAAGTALVDAYRATLEGAAGRTPEVQRLPV